MMRSGRSEGGADPGMIVREPEDYQQLDNEEQESFAIQEVPDNIRNIEKRSGLNRIQSKLISLE